MDIAGFFSQIPAELVYLLIGLIIGLESMGIPLPGETMLFTASIMASDPASTLSPWGIAIGAISGAIIGDSCGYLIGRRFGTRLFAFLGRKFPKHVTPGHVAYGQSLFARFGAATVFGGRFVALLRILAGPLAGMLRMPYKSFLVANASGGIVWAGGVTWIVYSLGQASQHWLENGAIAALVVLLVAGLIVSKVVGGRLNAAVKEFKAEQAKAGYPLETFADLAAFQDRSPEDLKEGPEADSSSGAPADVTESADTHDSANADSEGSTSATTNDPETVRVSDQRQGPAMAKTSDLSSADIQAKRASGRQDEATDTAETLQKVGRSARRPAPTKRR